jgi:t-SNARE complex subunit (syntaxin)
MIAAASSSPLALSVVRCTAALPPLRSLPNTVHPSLPSVRPSIPAVPSARTRREIKIVDSTLSDSAIDSIIESGKAQDVIKEALISDNLKNVVAVIEERHLDILKLEHQVLEIYELFRDLATLVDLQQESLDVIENRILKAKNYTEKAEVELQEAEEYQKKARQRRCCLLFIVLGVLVAILLPSISAAKGFI